MKKNNNLENTMADTEPRSVTLVDEEDGPEMTLEKMKEEEQAVIQRQIEATNAQLETLEKMETRGNRLEGVSMTAQELAVSILELSDQNQSLKHT